MLMNDFENMKIHVEQYQSDRKSDYDEHGHREMFMVRVCVYLLAMGAVSGIICF